MPNVRVPNSAGSEIVITTASDVIRYSVTDGVIAVDSDAEAETLLRTIEGSSLDDGTPGVAPEAPHAQEPAQESAPTDTTTQGA